jgi:CRP-like cAMP-binding protein
LVSAGLLALLTWIGVSFGKVNSHGWRFSLAELNLTHKALAELCGLTRLTVTKLLSRYRLEGQLVAVSNNDLLIPRLS